MATVFCNIYHENKWPWGESVKIITPNGMGAVEMSFENNNPGVCYLSGLSVHPSMRRKGIATMLMYCCIDYCKQRGVFRIDLNSVKESFVVDFYKKLGFIPLEEENGFIQMYKLMASLPDKPVTTCNESEEAIKPDFSGCVLDSTKFALLGKAAGKSLLEPHIETMRRRIERKIAEMPPAPEGYRYAWKVENFIKGGDAFTVTSNIVLEPTK